MFGTQEITTEVWKPIAGFEGYYEVSNLGNVRSVDRCREVTTRYGTKGFRKDKGRIIRQTDNGNGYLAVFLRKDGVRKRFYVHRLVALSFCEMIEGKSDVNHKNYDRRDNRASNLEFVTTKENVNYSSKRMRHPKNESKKSNTGEKYISKHKKRDKILFRVYIRQINVCKLFSTFEEAVNFRNEVIKNL